MGCLSFSDLVAHVPQPQRFDIEGGHVFVRPLMAKDVVEVQKAQAKGEVSNVEFSAKLVALCVINEAGQPIATEAEALTLPLQLLEQLAKRVIEVAGLDSNPN